MKLVTINEIAISALHESSWASWRFNSV